MKKIVALLTICIFVFTFNACSLLRKPLDHKTGFLNYLEETKVTFVKKNGKSV